MGKKLDITGKKFGMLTALYRTEKRYPKNGVSIWHFRCDCGNECDKNARSVITGKTSSCGCKSRKHGDAKSRLYNIWINMRMRCKDEGKKHQKHWGEKGISVCEEWLEYKAFKEWALNNGYSENLTIDRIDNDKGYCPNNCRWATYKEQARNTSANHYITIGNETHIIEDWCEILGTVTSASVYRRVREYGWSYEKALLTPSIKYSEFAKEKMRETKRKKSKPFLAINDAEILHFELQIDTEKFGFNRRSVGMALAGNAKCKTNKHFYKGYEWFYKDDYEARYGERKV